jgi:hypothetical protein
MCGWPGNQTLGVELRCGVQIDSVHQCDWLRNLGGSTTAVINPGAVCGHATGRGFIRSSSDNIHCLLWGRRRMTRIWGIGGGRIIARIC